MAISLDCNSLAVHALIDGTISRVKGGQLQRIAAGIVRESVIANFGFSGRPPWAALEHRKGGSPLIKSGGLKGSIYSRYDSDAAYVYTTKKYAPTHQFGAKKGEYGTATANVKEFSRKNGSKVRAHTRQQQIPWGDVPARPFMLIQDEDIVKIQAKQAIFIERGA
ncbi:phage virion morphogenesis protein [Candidatus Electronema sp. JM]|uniref:phage virion morphogenesis protein n=1 Tax=Candidatus Electronema sp. JM TaxID=3401571 RepID=UPI003AA9A883